QMGEIVVRMDPGAPLDADAIAAALTGLVNETKGDVDEISRLWNATRFLPAKDDSLGRIALLEALDQASCEEEQFLAARAYVRRKLERQLTPIEAKALAEHDGAEFGQMLDAHFAKTVLTLEQLAEVDDMPKGLVAGRAMNWFASQYPEHAARLDF